MKKNIIPAYFFLWLLFSLTTAHAESRQFGGFSLYIPTGWEAQESGSRVLLASPGQICVVAIQVSDSAGMDSKLIASEISQILKGAEPEAIGVSGGYGFEAEVGGVPSRIRVNSYGSKFLLFSVTGDREAFAPEIDKIWSSLEGEREQLRGGPGK